MFTELREAVINGNVAEVQKMTQAALDAKTEPQTILNEALIPAMGTVGEKFQKGEFYISEMMVAARAMYGGLNIVKPLLKQQKVVSKGKAVVGTVAGDLHDIGKNLVCMMMEGGGYDVVDLGINVPAQKFVDAIKEEKPDVVMLSALLTTTMAAMDEAIKAMVAAGVREQVIIGVGGAPVTQRFADSIGADFYTPDAGGAVTKVNELLKK